MIQYKKILMTLALLLTAVTGAWATDGVLLTTIESKDYTSFTSGSMTFDEKVTVTFSRLVENDGNTDGWYTGTLSLLTVAGTNGYTITSCKFYTKEGSAANGYTVGGESPSVYLYNGKVYNDASQSAKLGSTGVTKIEVYGIDPNAVEVTPVAEPDANTKQWTFNQPGGDVVLTPLYAPTATWATMGTEPEAKTLLPAAAEGVIAGTDDPLIVDGIVAKAGETKNPQGTVMFAVTPASANEAPALTAFSATVPTAKNNLITDDGAEVKVWYYIQGADTPDGETPTADNTFNNSEVSSLNVTVLSNKFDLTLKAANANTIDATDASKGTVSVKEGTTAVDKTKAITDGKLKAVKMGSEVKLNTKAGYKFRKVEVKKAEKTIKIGDQNYTVQNGETWKQFITRNQLSGWYVNPTLDGTWRVYMEGSDLFVLLVSTDGTTWNLLKLTSEDAPIDTDKQYKWGD